MFDKIAIRYKLIILLGLSGGFALLISSLIMVYSTYHSQSKSSMQVLHQLTDVISENMRAALAFGDARSASNILVSLNANPHILLAVATDDSGRVLGEYSSARLSEMQQKDFRGSLDRVLEENTEKLKQTQEFIQHIESDWMGVIQPVFFEGQPIGALAILSDTQVMWEEFRRFVLMQVIASALTVILLLFLSLKFQALFTRPILQMIDSMRGIAQTKNYRTVLESGRQDEFKNLYEVFNSMLADIQERDQLLLKQASTDALTELANRHYALEVMNGRIARARRTHEPFGLIMLDLDFFKKINDTHGHQVGDQVLQATASVLRGSARDYDLVARWGGEEFLLFCDAAPLEACLSVAQRIQQGLAGCRIECAQGTGVQVTASLGIYNSAQHPEESIESMLFAVDAALYRAKAAGRNTWCVA